MTAEELRLEQDASREKNWKRWGPYLSERQWGTVREDYSEGGSCWDYFPHDQARSRAYRWGEDGLLGITDRECRLCFSLALWNGKDPILKERLFGLTGPEGNHGEDVKEAYFYLDSTPTHSYMKGLYKYPQAEYPYALLVEETRRRGLNDPEFELEDTGVFAESRYFDVFVEYAKADAEDILIKITVVNRGPVAASLHLLPTLWFRNNWTWGCRHEGCDVKPLIQKMGAGVVARQRTLGGFRLDAETLPGGDPEWLFTENETNMPRIFGVAGPSPYSKDGFHERVVNGRVDAVEPAELGTKTAAWYQLDVPAGGQVSVRLRLRPEAMASPAAEPAFGPGFDREFAARRREADEFFATRVPPQATEEEARVMRQGYAGLLWSKQFYHYVVKDWLEGDSAQPAPPEGRMHGRNSDWGHLYNRDIISMPDKWEYPWYAAWDLAFHMIPFARMDADFAKSQLELFLREWYMHPNGQIPAYEFAFGDVNPPVHAWSVWRVYKMTGARGARDRRFLESAFQKLLLNFTWWVNRKDVEGKNLFSGGFLGLDNIGVFDRSKPLPGGGHLEQADGTAWMAFYCSTMLAISLKLARENPAYEDLASKFFEHFVRISDAMNTLGGTGLWDEEDGFYYDQLHADHGQMKLKVRSIVGLIPLFACEILDDTSIDRLPGFKKRMNWFLENRKDLAGNISYMAADKGHGHRLLAIPTRDKLEKVLKYMLDENEFLSPYGIRSVSRLHRDHPYVLKVDGQEHRVDYVPGESNTGLFGGNSNWRGPIWFPLNYLLIEALERYHHFYGDDLRVECPTGSGRLMNLKEVAGELASRLSSIFLTDAKGARPFAGGSRLLSQDPRDRDLVLFHEYFHGETGRGVGASHQTGWTALAVRCIEDRARARAATAGRKRERIAQPAPVST